MFDLLKPNFRESVKQKQAKQKEYHDRRSRQLNVEEGDQALVRVYREGLIRWRPSIVIEVIGNRAVRVKLQFGTDIFIKFERDHLMFLWLMKLLWTLR